jgi:hypothetical protein
LFTPRICPDGYAASSLLPLGLCGQAFANPAAINLGIFPRDIDYWVVRIPGIAIVISVIVRIHFPRRPADTGCFTLGKLAGINLILVNEESVQVNHVKRQLPWVAWIACIMSRIAAHWELPGWYQDHGHGW